MTPTGAPPISEVYVPQGHFRWVNLISGDIVQWSDEHLTWLRWDPARRDWFWWGNTGKGHRSWNAFVSSEQVHRQQTAVRLDFWVNAVIGLIVFAWAASVGCASGGAAALLLFIVWGALLAWLRARHQGVRRAVNYAAIGVVMASFLRHEFKTHSL